MMTLIENGEVFTPEAIGRASVLSADGTILKVGAISRAVVEALEVELDVVDADGCFVVPGFIDPHQHLLGGSGESGFSSQTPEISAGELVAAGVTTVVGCLGVDTTMKTMSGLLAKAKGLKEEGLAAYVWSGGYNVPPSTITKSIRDDIMFIEEIIGAGEIAISDERSTDPSDRELARLTNDAFVGGMLSRKAGVTQVHVGDQKSGLALLRRLLDDFGTPPQTLYPTHIERNESLMDEAIELSKRGCPVDIDTFEEDLHKWLTYYLDRDGNLDCLTVSSDASVSSPSTRITQISDCVVKHGMPLEVLLPFVTTNPARILKLKDCGELKSGKRSDVLILDHDSLEIRDVIVGGQALMRNGCIHIQEAFLKNSNRRIEMVGESVNAK